MGVGQPQGALSPTEDQNYTHQCHHMTMNIADQLKKQVLPTSVVSHRLPQLKITTNSETNGQLTRQYYMYVFNNIIIVISRTMSSQQDIGSEEGLAMNNVLFLNTTPSSLILLCTHSCPDTVCTKTIHGLNFSSFRGSDSHPRII